MTKSLVGGNGVESAFFENGTAMRYLPIASPRQTAPTTTEANAQTKLYAAGTFSLLSFYVDTNTFVSASSMLLRVAGASGTLTVSVAGGATGTYQDSTHSDAISSGDKICFAHNPGEAFKDFTCASIVCQFDGTSTTAGLFVSLDTLAGTTFNQGTASVTRYVPLAGDADNVQALHHATEAYAATEMKSDGTMSNMGIYISTNTSTNSMTQSWRTNGADGNQTITIGAASTGYIEDTTNSDVVAPGDTANYKTVSGAGTVNALTRVRCCTFISAGTGWDMRSKSMSAQTQSFSTSGSNYIHLLTGCGGFNDSKSQTEAQAQDKIPFAAYTHRLILEVVGNSSGSVSPVSRINGADANLTVTIGASATGKFEDTTHVDTIAANDLYCLKYGTTSSTTVSLQELGVTLDTVDPAGGPTGRPRRVSAFL